MKTLTTNDLTNVSGGASKNSEVSTALSSIQSSLKDLGSKNNSGGMDGTTMLMLGLMMSQKNQASTVVAAAPAPAAGPVISIRNGIRRW
jgi:bacteriocin-like protein